MNTAGAGGPLDAKTAPSTDAVADSIPAAVFNIERHALHDGPGIRTLVFMKGCPLRCFWCSNPEGQLRRTELMFTPNKCGSSGRCVDACPEDAIAWTPGEKPVVDRELCTVCAQCVTACPNGAFETVGHDFTAREVLNEVEKDFIFYRSSSGGVTVSGGEPMVQYKFIAELFELCREHGIATAIETCGYVPWSHYEAVIPYLDHVLIDVKHTDSEIHYEGTGVDPARIHDNVRRLARTGIPLIVRVPVITGFNDAPEHMRALADFIVDAGVTEIHLLPYHSLGEVKYAGLFRDYPAEGTRPPSVERMRELLQILLDAGLKASIEV